MAKEEVFRFRLKGRERDLLEMLAKARGVTPSELLRRLILEEVSR